MARRARKSRADNQRWEQMVSALRLMNFSFNNIKIYPSTHTEVVGVVTKLLDTLTPVLEEQEDVGFGFMDELLYIEGAVSLEETANNQMLVDRFNRCKVKYLTLRKGLSLEDLLKFFSILNAEAAKPTTEHPGELIDKANIKTIHIVEAEVADLASKSKRGANKTLLDWYVKAAETLAQAQTQLRDNPEADLKPLFRLVDDMMATIRSKGHEPYLLLAAMGRGMDPHVTHGVNVAILCCVLGDLYGLNSGQLNTLCAAAFLHDLGRLTIPVEWTQDHSPLSESDRAIAAQHADWGFLLLLRHKDVPIEIGLLAAHHHPGQGPRKQGDDVDVFQRILNLADTYDLALYGERYYWKKQRRERMLAHLLNKRGVLHEPTLVKLLVNCVGYYPVGSLVRLQDGRRGIVVRPNSANPARPKVYLFEERAPAAVSAPNGGGDHEEPPPVIADLAELEPSGFAFKASVAAAIAPEPGLDLGAILARKKEYLLSHAL